MHELTAETQKHPVAAMKLLKTGLCFLLLSTTAVAAETTLEGRVTDAEGNPLEGVKIFLIAPESTPEQSSKAVSGEDGKFSISDVQPKPESGSQYRYLVVYNPGWALGGTMIRDVRNPAKELKFILKKPSPISIRIHDPQGKPLRNTRAALGYFRDGATDNNVSAEKFLEKMFSFRTDEEGKFSLNLLAENSALSLVVDSAATGKQQVYIRAVENDLSVKLRITGKLTGRILADDPKAVRNLQISVRTRPDVSQQQKPPETTIYGMVVTRSDAEGKFQIPALAAGNGSITVEIDKTSPFRLQKRIEFTVKAGETTDLEIPLVKGIPVKGSVVDRDTKKPIAGVGVYVWNRTGESNRMTTDEKGEFQTFMGPGRVSVSLRELPSPYLKAINDYRNETIEPNDKELVLEPFTLKRGVSLKGKVVDENDRPIEGAQVTARWEHQEGSLFTLGGDSATSDAQGNFTLAKVSGDALLGLTAGTENRGLMELVKVQPGEANKPVTLKIVPEAVAFVKGRVVDQQGKPVANARVRFIQATKTPDGRTYGSRPVYFDGQRELTTNAQGEFQTSRSLARRVSCNLSVDADGMVTRNTDYLDLSAPVNLIEVPDIVLERVFGVKGRVVDHSGKPIPGVTVRSHGQDQRHVIVSAKTDKDGRFDLKGIHPEAHFVLAVRDGYGTTGIPVGKFDKQAVITLRKASEDPVAEKRLSLKRFPRREREKYLLELIEQVAPRYRQSQSDYFRSEILKLVTPYDPNYAFDRLKTLRTESARSELLAKLDHTDDALDLATAIEDARSRTRAILTVVDAVTETDQKLNLLAQALLHARTIQDPSRRVHSLGDIAERLFDLGEKSEAKAIVEEGEKLAARLAPAEWSGYARGHFAETLALFDLEAALNLVKDLKDEHAFNRHHGNIAHELAAINPEQALRVLKMIKEESNRDRYAIRVCYRMAPVDLNSAREIAAAVTRTEWKAYTYGVMGMALNRKDPDTAKTLLNQASETLDQYTTLPYNTNSREAFPTACVLLRFAEKIDPESTGDYFWKAIAMHPGPATNTYYSQPEQLATEQNIRTSNLALLLALYGFDPEPARELMEPVFQRMEELLSRKETSQEMHTFRRPVIFAAMMLTDPERSLEWHKQFFQKVEDKELRLISPAQPWRIMAGMLVDSEDEFWRYIQKELRFTWWVIDQEDL